MNSLMPIVGAALMPVAFVLAAGAIGAAAAPLAAAQTTDALVTASAESVNGEVAEVFGNKVVVRGRNGERTLVELGNAAVPKVGEPVRIEGRRVNGSLVATRVNGNDAAATSSGAGTANSVGAPAGNSTGGDATTGATPVTAAALDAVRRAGYEQGRVDEVKREHVEVDARDRDGQWWELKVDRDGRILKREHKKAPLPVDEAAIRRLLQDNGYRFERIADVDHDEIEVLATNDHNERVKIEIDGQGRIKKEKRLR